MTILAGNCLPLHGHASWPTQHSSPCSNDLLARNTEIVAAYFVALARSVGRVSRPERRALGSTLLTFTSIFRRFGMWVSASASASSLSWPLRCRLPRRSGLVLGGAAGDLSPSSVAI
jgi:hypothetical protein